MAYEKKTWKNRQSEYPNRRVLAPVADQENAYDVTRNEGLVMEEGDAFDQNTMNDLEKRISNGFVDSGVNVYTHTKSGTVHNFAGSGANGRAKLTANVAAGDTFTVNGAPVSAYMGAESAADAMAGGEWNGRWVSFVFDGGTLNFKGGGGLPAADKAKLIPENIKSGVTLFAGTPKQVVGSFTSDGNIYNSAVLENLVGYSKGQRIVGTMPDLSGVIAQVADGWDGGSTGGLWAQGQEFWIVPGRGFWGTFDPQKQRLILPFSKVASIVGLTPDKLPAGTTILGVTGNLTWESLLPQVFVGQNGATVDPNILGSAVISSGNMDGRGIYIAGWQSSAAAIFTKAISTNTFAAVEITIGEMLGREANTNLSIGLTNVASPGSWDSGYISRQNYVSTISQGNVYRCDFPAGQSGYVKIGWTSAHGFVAQTRLIKR